eukprot:5496682-Amphidinium_carterae.1
MPPQMLVVCRLLAQWRLSSHYSYRNHMIPRSAAAPRQCFSESSIQCHASMELCGASMGLSELSCT